MKEIVKKKERKKGGTDEREKAKAIEEGRKNLGSKKVRMRGIKKA